jgi:hypothetical protein
MFTQRVITNNVEKVGDLEGNDLNVWRGGRICLECVKKYGKEKQLWNTNARKNDLSAM